MAGLVDGIRCKACDRSKPNGDKELCPHCLNISRSMFRDLDPPDEEGYIILQEVMNAEIGRQENG